MRILGRVSSINVRKVLWTAMEIGAPYAHEEGWAGPTLSTRSPDFLRLNPNGLVPVIEDDGVVLWESNTICRYLAHKHVRHDLLPATAAARARVEMWMDWQATELNRAWSYAFMALVRRHPDWTDAAQIAASAAAWNGAMLILEARLAETRAYAAGDAFTLADIVLGLSVHRWRSTPIERPALPAVEAFMSRLAARPGFMQSCRPDLP